MSKLYRFLLAAIVAPALFTACSKDDPEPEVPLEEFDGVVLNFTEVERHDDHYHEVENPEEAELRFKREQGSFVLEGEDHLHLTEGKSYVLDITIFRNGENTNDDFEGALHQFFFVGAPEGVLDYAYADEDGNGMGVGFMGYLEVMEHTEAGFDFTVGLVHFSEGSKAALNLQWNDEEYAQKIAGGGGHHDFTGTFELHPVEGDHHGDDEHEDHDDHE